MGKPTELIDTNSTSTSTSTSTKHRQLTVVTHILKPVLLVLCKARVHPLGTKNRLIHNGWSGGSELQLSTGVNPKPHRDYVQAQVQCMRHQDSTNLTYACSLFDKAQSTSDHVRRTNPYRVQCCTKMVQRWPINRSWLAQPLDKNGSTRSNVGLFLETGQRERCFLLPLSSTCFWA